MCVKVTLVGKASDGTLSHIGGSEDDGSAPWGLTIAEAIQRIESNDWTFFSAQPAADPVPVRVMDRNGTKSLTTAADDTQTNNLAQLPVSSSPLVGVDPQFPLSIPGPRQPRLVEVVGRGASGGPVVVPPDGTGRFKMPAWTGSQALKRVRIACNAPFPADLEVYVERDPSRPDYVEATHKLRRVDSTSPGAVWALEDQGLGWYDWTLSILDASYPHRFTPFIVPIGIPKAFGGGTGLTLYVRNRAYNRYCAGPSTPLSVILYRATYMPPYTYTPGSSSTGSNPPARVYKVGPFAVWTPAVKNIGQVTTKASKRLEVKSPNAVGMVGWPLYGVFDDPATSKRLCQPVGFAILAGPGAAGGGVGFSGTADFGVALAILQPNVPAHAGNVLFRFVKLGAASMSPMDVEGFLTTPNATVTPSVLLDPADQVALVVDANPYGGYQVNPGRARLLDLGHGASPLATFEFNGTMISATVQKNGPVFEATVTTNAETRTVTLPNS